MLTSENIYSGDVVDKAVRERLSKTDYGDRGQTKSVEMLLEGEADECVFPSSAYRLKDRTRQEGSIIVLRPFLEKQGWPNCLELQGDTAKMNEGTVYLASTVRIGG